MKNEPKPKNEPKSMKEAVFGAAGKTPPNENGMRPAPAPPPELADPATVTQVEPKGVKGRIDRALALMQQAQQLLGDDIDLTDEMESAKALDIAPV